MQRLVRLQLRQLPCLQMVLPNCRCLKRSRYQSVGQDEEEDGTESEDMRQNFNKAFGRALVKLSLIFMVLITGILLFRKPSSRDVETLTEAEIFKRDAPLILYIAAIEVLICGACAHTAAVMYKRRVHALKHPSEADEKERERYIKVDLEKEPGKENRQLYGLSFRPSSDGLECLLVEAVRPGSLLDKWNSKREEEPIPEEIAEAALGDAMEPTAPGTSTDSGRKRTCRRVQYGAAVVAVNDASGDIGMMQLQLTKPKVTMWVRPDVLDVLAPSGSSEAEAIAFDAGNEPAPPGDTAEAVPEPTCLGRPEEEGWGLTGPGAAEAAGPRCACVGVEDEEPQILVRWMVCSLLLGWVTLLPTLLMQPHEERPRQQLFRKYLLKPCLIMLPLTILFWLLDCVEVAIQFQIMPPALYFFFCHMLVPAVLIYYLMQMQAADEQLVLEQRKGRLGDLDSSMPAVVEDPPPTLLKELVTVNPVALVWISCCAAIPIVLFSLLTPMKTSRGKMAQGYVNVVYGPCILLQVCAGYVFWNLRFMSLPRFYFEGIGSLVTLPCFVVWSLCLVCASHYGRKDATLVEYQRKDRAKEAIKNAGFGIPEPAAAPSTATQADSEPELVDCTEATSKEWDLVYSA